LQLNEDYYIIIITIILSINIILFSHSLLITKIYTRFLHGYQPRAEKDSFKVSLTRVRVDNGEQVQCQRVPTTDSA